MNSRIIALKLLSPFGLRGLIKANLYVDQKVICGNKLYDESLIEYSIEDVIKDKKGVFKLKISNYDTPEDVGNLRNKFLYIEKTSLPKLSKNEFYIYEIIGSGVFFDNNEIGKVVDVKNFGAGDLLEVSLSISKGLKSSTDTVFIPMNDDCIENICEDNSEIKISKFAFDNYM